MAGRNDIEINLKTIAKTGDLANLLAYIHKLGKSLREVGTEDAKVLRNQLAAALKSIPKNATADQVKALVPDLSKINALGSLAGIDKKLAQFGTAQAKAVQQTVKEMRGAIEGGALSDETIEMLSASLQKFVEQANKLPPAGLKKLATDIQKTIANTQELQEVIAQANDIEFNVKTDGTGSLDELQHKIEVIANAKNLDDGIKELNAALLALDSKESEAVAEQLERIKKILEGELGQKQVKELRDAMRELANVSSSLSSRELQRVGNSLNTVQAQGKALGEEMRRTGNAARDGFSFIDELSSQLGASTNAVTKGMVNLLSRIKGIGPAVSANAAKVLGLFALVYAGIKKILGGLEEIRQNRENFKLNRLEQSIEASNREFETYIKLLDVAYEKDKMALDLRKDQLDAIRELQKAQIELNRAKELEGVESDTERNRINAKYDRLVVSSDYAGKRESFADKAERANLEIDNLKKQIEAQKKKIADNGVDMASALKGQKESFARAGGWWNMTKAAVGGATFDLLGNSEAGKFDTEKAAQYGEKYKSLVRERMDDFVELNQLEAQLKDKEARRDTLIAKSASGEKSPEELRIEAEKEAAESKLRDDEAREERRIAQIKRQRDREKELYEYDRDLAETNYQRGRRSPWQNDVEQLAEAEKMLERYRREEKEALEERERVMKEVAAQGGWQTITEEQEFRFNNATSDLQRARSSRYQEQSTIDQLKKQMHDRRFDESEARHTIEKEDADWERNRIYSRANYAQKLAMDRRRYAAAQKEYAEADAAILADNAGTKTLSPEERKVMERRRNEARAYMTESREAISSAMYEGDAQRAGFYNSIMRHGNRLTAMGLGGDVANWDKQTANNTKTLVSQNRDLLQFFRNDRRGGGVDMKWGL